MKLPRFLVSLLVPSLLACGTSPDGDDTGVDAGSNTPADAGKDQDAGQTSTDAGNDDAGTTSVTCDPAFGQADACGGNLGGVWTYQSACGRTPIGNTLEDQCPTVDITAERFVSGSGTLTLTGATFELDVSTIVHVEASIPAACTGGLGCATIEAGLEAALPQATIDCPASGAGCDCTIDGPVGSASSGQLATNGGVATVDGDDTYYYCVEGNVLTYRQFGTGNDEPVYVLRR